MKFLNYERIVIAITFGIGFICGGLFQSIAHAHDAGACYTITDSDARTYCLARAHREVGTCYAIKDAGLRSQCLAEVRK